MAAKDLRDYKERREYMRKYQREWAASRRSEYFDGRSCANCSSSDNLELHHLDKTDKVSHKIWSWSIDRRVAELLKCAVLCRECHRIETNKRYPVRTHGAGPMYKSGCRCEKCRGFASERGRKYRLRRQASNCGAEPPANPIALSAADISGITVIYLATLYALSHPYPVSLSTIQIQ